MFLLRVDKLDFPAERAWLVELVKKIAGVEKLGKCWVERYLKRHPHLCCKLVNRIDRQRVIGGRPKEL